VRQRYRVHGTIRNKDAEPRAELHEEVERHPVDLLDRDRVEAVVSRVRPAWVFHLAALSSPAASWEDPAATITNNVGGQANLLNALVRLDPMPRVLVVGSTDEYGRVTGRRQRLDEDTPLRPLSPYAVSKVAQDYLALQYFLSRGLPAVRVRPFNHAGPRQAPQFAIASFPLSRSRGSSWAGRRHRSRSAISRPNATSPTSGTWRGPICWRCERAGLARCTTSAQGRRSSWVRSWKPSSA